MIKQILLLLSLALPVAGQSQTLPPPDTIYFDRDWERTQLPEDRAYARIARHVDGKTVGTVRDYFYPSWKKQGEGKLLQESPDVLQGLCTAWYENGRLNFRGTYVQGLAQADFQHWAEDGHLVKCRYVYQDALPMSKGKMHSQYNSGSSRQVFTVDLPTSTVGVVYRLDIRDESQPPVTWNTALALGSAYLSPSATLVSMLSTGARALNNQAAAPTPRRWYPVPLVHRTGPGCRARIHANQRPHSKQALLPAGHERVRRNPRNQSGTGYSSLVRVPEQ